MEKEKAEQLVELITDLVSEIADYRIAYDKDWGDYPPVSKEHEIGEKLQELLESL